MENYYKKILFYINLAFRTDQLIYLYLSDYENKKDKIRKLLNLNEKFSKKAEKLAKKNSLLYTKICWNIPPLFKYEVDPCSNKDLLKNKEYLIKRLKRNGLILTACKKVVKEELIKTIEHRIEILTKSRKGIEEIFDR